jgi:uncharacterized paraquat-inducible protein A
MQTEMIEIADQEIMEKEANNEPRVQTAKRGRLKKCSICGMSTYQKEGICVLCKTGIRESGEALMTG